MNDLSRASVRQFFGAEYHLGVFVASNGKRNRPQVQGLPGLLMAPTVFKIGSRTSGSGMVQKSSRHQKDVLVRGALAG
jgi:hypothetical protein